MKVQVALCVLTVVAFSYGTPYPQDCYYDERGLCYKECEEGTHSYTTGCSPVTPEPTCDEPHPVAGRGAVCDYSACHCNPPTLRDSVSRKCVQPEECPKKEKETPKEEKETPKEEKEIPKKEKETPKEEKETPKKEKETPKEEKETLKKEKETPKEEKETPKEEKETPKKEKETPKEE